MSKDNVSQITSFTPLYVSLKVSWVEKTMAHNNLCVDYKLRWL